MNKEIFLFTTSNNIYFYSANSTVQFSNMLYNVNVKGLLLCEKISNQDHAILTKR